MFKISVHQPQFLPWAGYWHKLAWSDLHVVMAGVQFDQSSYQHRVKLGSTWLTLPVAKHQSHTMLADVVLAEGYDRALKKIARTLRDRCMSKANPFGDRLGDIVAKLETWNHKHLLDLDVYLMQSVGMLLGLECTVSIDTMVRSKGKREDLDDLLAVHAKGRQFVYLSGSGAREYMHFRSLKQPAATWFQAPKPSLSFDTIVQLIAQERDPLSVIRAAGMWQSEEGQIDGSALAETGAGVGPALR